MRYSNQEETWLPIPNAPGYEISSHGRVRSFKRLVDGRPRILKPKVRPEGYTEYSICYPNKIMSRLSSSLVLEAFIGPRPDGLVVCHNDGNPGNNTVSNLRYDTYKSNADDCIKHGTRRVGEDVLHSKLTACQVLEIRFLAASGVKQQAIAERYGIRQCTVSEIVNRKIWGHVEIR